MNIDVIDDKFDEEFAAQSSLQQADFATCERRSFLGWCLL
jgi:hypothetical protein